MYIGDFKKTHTVFPPPDTDKGGKDRFSAPACVGSLESNGKSVQEIRHPPYINNIANNITNKIDAAIIVAKIRRTTFID